MASSVWGNSFIGIDPIFIVKNAGYCISIRNERLKITTNSR
nr:MAG TPA: hypothetical protein [Caudoviricetes sp.]